MTTIATLFTGFGGVEVGAMAAGLTPLWGVELDPAIAQVANDNLGDHVITADARTIDPSVLARPAVLHASPPCPSFSRANARGGETKIDIELAEAVARFIDVLRPPVFTLENVYLYRKSQSWRIILQTLYECGYWCDVAHVDAADYGVPQNRQRMIVRALRGRMVPYLPEPERPWRGWYEAISDLIPTLPESQFAPWQLERLPEGIADFAIDSGIAGAVSPAAAPINAITGENGRRIRAFLVDSAGYPDESGITIPVIRRGEQLSNTVVANYERRSMRALLVDDDNGRPDTGSPSIRPGGEPAMTIRGGKIPPHRAWLASCRVVALTPRCLARFQSFPDWFVLPGKRSLAYRGIGNAVPPLLYEKIIRPLVTT